MSGKAELSQKSEASVSASGRPAPQKAKRTIKRNWGLSGFFNLAKWKGGFKFERDVVIEEEIER